MTSPQFELPLNFDPTEFLTKTIIEMPCPDPSDLDVADFMKDMWTDKLDSCKDIESDLTDVEFLDDEQLMDELNLMDIRTTSSLDIQFSRLCDSETFLSAAERLADRLESDFVEVQAMEVQSDFMEVVRDEESDEDSGEEYVPKQETHRGALREMRKIWTRTLRPRELKFITNVCVFTEKFTAGVPPKNLHDLWDGSSTSLARFLKANRKYIVANRGMYTLTRQGKHKANTIL